MATRNIVFDIETGSGPEDEILKYADIQRKAPHRGLKDPEKIAQNLTQIESDFEAEKKSFVEKAALTAETGIVLAVGFKQHGLAPLIFENIDGSAAGEKELLRKVFSEFQCMWTLGDSRDVRFIGHNIKSFDIPFLARRAMRHGIWNAKTKYAFWKTESNGKYFHDAITDTMEVWALGEYGRRVSLNNLARYFGLGEKTGSGDQFAQWFLRGEHDRALEYLEQDLALTWGVAKCMGIIEDVDATV